MFPCLLSFIFIFACSLAFMFAMFELVAVGDGLGTVVTAVFALLFELSVVLQPAQKTARASRVNKDIVRFIEVPP